MDFPFKRILTVCVCSFSGSMLCLTARCEGTLMERGALAGPVCVYCVCLCVYLCVCVVGLGSILIWAIYGLNVLSYCGYRSVKL